MGRVQAVIFDLDDTMYPERQFAHSGFAAVAREFGAKLHAGFDVEARMRQLLDSPDRGRVFNIIVAEAGIAEAEAVKLAPMMIETYRCHKPTLTPYPDALPAIRAAREKYAVGMITDGPVEVQSAKIDALHLRELIPEIVITGVWDRQFWKPHPCAFEEMARRLAVPHEGCVYVADNLSKDFVAPNALGWLTVHVRRPDGIYIDKTPPPGGEPRVSIETLDELAGLLPDPDGPPLTRRSKGGPGGAGACSHG